MTTMIDAYLHHAEGPAGARLAFLLHGTGGDERQLLPLGRHLLPGARLVAPRGDVSEGGQARFFRRHAEGVYDMADLARATGRMAGFVAAHVAASAPSEVVAIGYSNGANILASTLLARPDLFHRVVLMHPLIPFRPPQAPVIAARILITAGERDPICPPDLTRALADVFRDRGSAVALHWQPGGHGIDRSEIEAAARFLAAAPASGRTATRS
jgi:phospholipase/carboxylesterase